VGLGADLGTSDMGGAVPGKVKLKSYQRSQGVFLSSSIVLFLNSSGSRGRVKLWTSGFSLIQSTNRMA
jgi:hypothetical protein